jgi:hypothetical protein
MRSMVIVAGMAEKMLLDGFRKFIYPSIEVLEH